MTTLRPEELVLIPLGRFSRDSHHWSKPSFACEGYVAHNLLDSPYTNSNIPQPKDFQVSAHLLLDERS